MLHHNCKNEIATANGGAACSKYVDYLWNEVEEEGWLFEVEKGTFAMWNIVLLPKNILKNEWLPNA